MALVLSDRIKETTVTTGTGSIHLGGALGGFGTFAGGIGDGNTTYYVIENDSDFEIGLGTYTSASNTLSRDTVINSTNSNNKLDLTGVSFVFCAIPASKSVFKDANDNIVITGDLALDDVTADHIEAYTISVNDLTSSGDVIANNVISSGSMLSSGLLTLKRTDAGSFFHSYVSDGTERTIALYSDGTSSPEWRLGLKTNPSDEGVAPSYAYIFAEDGNIGLVANSDNSLQLTHGGGFTLTNKSDTMFTSASATGTSVFTHTASYPSFIVKGTAGQSANLQEWKNSSSTLLAKVTTDGSINSSGSISADNGILLNDQVPNSVTNKFYNDGGSLYFNGTSIGGDVSLAHVNTQDLANTASGVAISGWAAYANSASGVAVSGWADSTIDIRDAAISGWAIGTFDDGDYSSSIFSASGINVGKSGIRIPNINNTSEFLSIDWTTVSDICYISSTASGGGTARDLRFRSPNAGIDMTKSGTNYVTITDTDGNEKFDFGSTYLRGRSSQTLGLDADRWANIFANQIDQNITTASHVGHIIKAHASQSADLSQWQDDAGSVLSCINKDGKLGILTDDPDYALDVAGNISLNEYIYHNGDTNTYIRFRGDQLDFVAGGVTMLTLDETSQDRVIINNGKNDVDFRVEGDNDENLIYTDAANDMVGIGTNSPAYKLDIVGHNALVQSSGLIVGNSGIVLANNAPTVTTNTLYNVGSSLYFNGKDLTGVSGWALSTMDIRDDNTTYDAGSGLELHDTTFHAAISGDNLLATNTPSDNYIPSFDLATRKFTWVEQSAGGGGGGDAKSWNVTANTASGVAISGWAAYANSASGVAVSGWADSTMDIKDNAVSGWASAYTDTSIDYSNSVLHSSGISISDSGIRFTNPGNSEYVELGFDDNKFIINTVANGGTARMIQFQEDGASRGYMDAASNAWRFPTAVYPDSDATKNLGYTTLRWAVGYFDQLDQEIHTATDVGHVIKGAASQSANLSQWQGNDGTVVAYVDQDGSIATSGTLGASGDITANADINLAGNLELGGYINDGSLVQVRIGDSPKLQVQSTNVELRGPFLRFAASDGTDKATLSYADTDVLAVKSADNSTLATVIASGANVSGVHLANHVPANTAYALYNEGGTLKFDGSAVNTDTQLTTEQVQDIAGALVATGGTKTGITIAYEDSTGDMDFAVDHDAANNFVANEHINHTSVTLTAGDGITGGGDISANRSFTVDAGSGVVVDMNGVHAQISGANLLATNSLVDNYVPSYDAATGKFTWVSAGGGGMSNFILEDDSGDEVTIEDGKEVKFIGDGITTNWTDVDNGTDADPFDLTFSVDAAQTNITSIYNTSLAIGYGASHANIDFGTDNAIIFDIDGTQQIKLTDGVLAPITDSDVDLGTHSLRFKDVYIDTLYAGMKAFLIDHPTKEGMNLQYGALEGPENGVYVRGTIENENIIELPDYWTGLVDDNSITVQLTAKKYAQPNLFVDRVEDNKVYLRSDKRVNAYYIVHATRKDVDPLEVEWPK